MITARKRSHLLVWAILATLLTAVLSAAVVGTTGILEPAYVSRDLRNVEDVSAICATSIEARTITGRLAIDPRRSLPAHVETGSGPTFILWPRGFRVRSDGLVDEDGDEVAAVGGSITIAGVLVDGTGTETSPILLTFARFPSDCYVFVGQWPVSIGNPT